MNKKQLVILISLTLLLLFLIFGVQKRERNERRGLVDVIVTNFDCEDQERYLIEALNTVPYSSKRPRRFNYIQMPYEQVLEHVNNTLDNPLIIFGATIGVNFPILRTLSQATHKGVAAIFHKDEYCKYTRFSFPKTDLVYRGYYDERLVNSGIGYFPLGVRKVFPHVKESDIIPSSKRKTNCNLIVSLSTSESRVQLVNHLRQDTELGCFVYTIDTWSKNFSNYLPPEEYKDKLMDSVFTLSPRGHNVECYRMYESFETGSIPIVEDWESEEKKGNCHNSLYPFKKSGAPFIYVKDWKNIIEIIRDLLKDKRALDRRQREMMQWYRSFKEDVIAKFEDDLYRAFNLSSKP